MLLLPSTWLYSCTAFTTSFVVEPTISALLFISSYSDSVSRICKSLVFSFAIVASFRVIELRDYSTPLSGAKFVFVYTKTQLASYLRIFRKDNATKGKNKTLGDKKY